MGNNNIQSRSKAIKHNTKVNKRTRNTFSKERLPLRFSVRRPHAILRRRDIIPEQCRGNRIDRRILRPARQWAHSNVGPVWRLASERGNRLSPSRRGRKALRRFWASHRAELSGGQRADNAISLCLDDLDTKRSQRLDKLLWRFGVGDQAMDLVGGTDSRNTPPAKLAGICHHGDFLGYPH